MKLSENIKNMRKEHGLTQEQLAEVLGVTAASVSKWETGQTQPDLVLLAELAEYFAVSVDALMGHRIPADRIAELTQQMKALEQSGEKEQAVALAEKLLRSYPNDPVVLEEAESLYYRLHVRGSDAQMLRASIRLLERQLALLPEADVLKRLELYIQLGNRYELLEEWDRAEDYYRKSNVMGYCDSNLAQIQVLRGEYEKSIGALTDSICRHIYGLMSDIQRLSEAYDKLAEPEKGIAALRWAAEMLWIGDGYLQGDDPVLSMSMNTQLAWLMRERGDMQQAEHYIRRAAACALGKEPVKGMFLQPGAEKQILSNVENKAEFLLMVLQQMEDAHLLAVAEQALQG